MSDDFQRRESDLEGLGWIVVGLVVWAFLLWSVPLVVVLVTQRTLPPLGFVEALVSVGRLLGAGHLDDPASAYAADVARLMPSGRMWWFVAVGYVLLLAVASLLAFRRFEPEVARARLGRRPGDPRGARPRDWARPRDLRGRGRTAGGFALGTLDGRAIRADEESHVVLVAPTRAGKTTRCVIPWLLEHSGPAIVTSTKHDVLEATRAHRERLGRVWIFDPFGEETAGWSPLAGCRDWSGALRQAQWLADASADGSSEIARYWRGEAAKLLAPLLHAAALSDRTMLDVLRWVDGQTVKEPTAVLVAEGADAAGRQLWSIEKLDGRNKGTTYMSASSVLAAYRYPEVVRSLGDDLLAHELLASAGGTLYLVAAERHQRLLAPLLVALLSSIVNEAAESGVLLKREHRLRVLLDEAANIVPLPDLPRMLSQAAGHGVRFATVWQSLAQVQDRHGRDADTVLANSTTKLFLGPMTDESTRSYVREALGHQRKAAYTRTNADAASLQQLSRGRALLITGDAMPAVVELPKPM